MNFSEAIAQINGLADLIEEAAQEGIDEVAKFGLFNAQILSDGDATYADLRREDHPYARRHGKPRRMLPLINRHRGVFYEAWHTVARAGGAQLVNDSDVADFIKYGTTVMFARGIDLLIEDRMAEAVPVLVAGRIAKALP